VFLSDYFDAELSIWSEQNTKNMGKIDPRRMAKKREAQAPLFNRSLERLGKGEMRWCGTLFPTNAYAQDAGMSLHDFEDFMYSACLLDLGDRSAAWRKVHEEQRGIADFLSLHDEIH